MCVCVCVCVYLILELSGSSTHEQSAKNLHTIIGREDRLIRYKLNGEQGLLTYNGIKQKKTVYNCAYV
jgi:hypothetical protein